MRCHARGSAAATVRAGRTGTVLSRAQCPYDVLALVVLWRLRCKLALRGMVFGDEAGREWENKLTPMLADDLRRRRHGLAGCNWDVNETCLKVHVRWCYRYLVIDRSGALVDVMFSEHCDVAAARAFFTLCQGSDRSFATPQ